MSITAKLKDMGGHDREVVADSEDEDSMTIDRASRTFSANRGLDSSE